MSIQNVPLMRAIAAKMIYLDKRQGVLAQNIANADTPGYRPQDLTKVDFGKVLEKVSGKQQVTLTTTSSEHVLGKNDIANAKGRMQGWVHSLARTGR